MKMNIRNKNKIMVVAIVAVIGILLTSYGISTFSNIPIKTYNLTIYLNETEDYEPQVENIGTLLLNYYIQKLNSTGLSTIIPTIAWDYAKPPYVTTITWETYLEDILKLLESHGYRVTYTEEQQPV